MVVMKNDFEEEILKMRAQNIAVRIRKVEFLGDDLIPHKKPCDLRV